MNYASTRKIKKNHSWGVTRAFPLLSILKRRKLAIVVAVVYLFSLVCSFVGFGGRVDNN